MKLIYERSQEGRRASSLPRNDLPVPEVPEELRRERPPRLPEIAEPELVRHFTRLSTRTFGVDTGFYPLGSCTMKHNPRVNERVVNLPGFRDLHPLQEEDGAQGRARAHVAAAGDPRGGRRPARGVAPARRGLAGRADRAPADARLLRRPRRGRRAPQDRHPRHGPRHEPGERDDGRLRGDAGPDRPARKHRRRGSSRQGRRAHRRPDAHEPLDARALRREHRGDRRDLPRRRRAHVLRRREPECGLRDLPPRRHGVRHRPLQPAQDVLPAARRRWARRRPDRGSRAARAVPARARRRPRRRRVPARLRPAEDDRQGARILRAVRRLRALVRLHPLATGRAFARCPRSRS